MDYDNNDLVCKILSDKLVIVGRNLIVLYIGLSLLTAKVAFSNLVFKDIN